MSHDDDDDDEEAIIVNIVQRNMNKSIVTKYRPYKGYTVNIPRIPVKYTKNNNMKKVPQT